jgi:taurine dioxygenase
MSELLTSFHVNPIGQAGAAEVVGLDCSRALGSETLAEVRAAFRRYPILVFRDQHLDARSLAAFTAQLGQLEWPANFQHAHPDHGQVLILSNELRPDGTAIGVVDAGDFLHSDSQSMPIPSVATLLYAERNPKTGGDTEYCNMYLVYEALPAELKARIAGLYGINRTSKFGNKRAALSQSRPGARDHYEGQLKQYPDVRHPVVRIHPETGRPALFISPRFTIAIDGLPEDESDRLLDELLAYTKDERFRYVHKWRDNDLVMWDNRCLTHRATGGYVLPDIRRMIRTVIGDTGSPALSSPSVGASAVVEGQPQ